MTQFIAVDVGAESGRLLVGVLQNGTLTMQEAHRFANGMINVHGSLYWNVLEIFQQIKIGLRKIRQEFGGEFVSLGIDTWAVDFGLLDRDGNLLANPVAYRDARTEGMIERAVERVTREDIYAQTGGIQFLSLNTLYQLLALAERHSPLLECANTLLMMPDMLAYWLTDRIAVEYTNATTTQFYDSRTGTWARGLLDQLEIPHHFLPEVVLPGTILGKLTPGVAKEVGFDDLAVVAVASHDTASAVAAVPANQPDFAWMSSGTWSLLGGTADHAITTPEALAYNFSNYGGANGSVLPWKNIMGLWLVQECRRQWEREGQTLSYDELTHLSANARPFIAVINPDESVFFAPENMPAAIQQYCRETGQSIPATPGEIVRVALESLALRYRWVLDRLERLAGIRYPALHIVGGGSQNALLNQFAADATGKPVIAGPVEATGMGNIAVQAVATGHIGSLDDARRVMRQSIQTQIFAPQPSPAWAEAYGQLEQLVEVRK
jgi:rhamnulokinase